MAHAARRSCGCPLPGSVQGQAGWGFEQPGLVEGVPAHGRGVGTRGSVRSLPTQTNLWFILWFYDSLSDFCIVCDIIIVYEMNFIICMMISRYSISLSCCWYGSSLFLNELRSGINFFFFQSFKLCFLDGGLLIFPWQLIIAFLLSTVFL